MAKKNAAFLVTSGILVAAVLAVLVVSSRQAVAARGMEDLTPEKLWSWLKDAKYENWAPWPGQTTDFYEGTSPHGAWLKMYINRDVTADLSDPPHGSVIIKENFTKDKKLAAITIMKRVKGYDAENNDWYWVKYNADGTVAKMSDKPVAGKVTSCIKCHANAKDSDYIFTNDK